MSFSNEWEKIYQAGGNLSIWPWSDVVSFVRRYIPNIGPDTKVLELGFGAGANIPFFKSLNVHYTGIEGSSTIVDKVRESYPSMASQLIVGDFINHQYEGKYDLVLDRSSLTHNDTDAIKRCLNGLASAMDSRAKFIGIDWFSTRHDSTTLGEAVDSHTRQNISNGQFTNVGSVHFSDEQHIQSIFQEAGFKIIVLQHKENTNYLPEPESRFAAWNFVAERC